MIFLSKWNKVNEELISAMYNDGMSGIKIGEELNITHQQVYYILNKNDVKRRKNGQNWKKYTANYRFFETIDSEEKAYWLGFIAADGYVTKQNKVGITLSSKDKSHLEKFKESISATHPVSDYIGNTPYKNNTEYSKIIITSKEMKYDLVRLGIVENKTLLLSFPLTDSELLKHYVRGYVDGDGSISRTKSSGGNLYEYQLKVAGTKNFLEGILKFLNQSHQKLYKRNQDDKDNYYFSIGGNIQVEKVLDSLYEDSNIYLDRKHQRYLDLKAQSSKVGMP